MVGRNCNYNKSCLFIGSFHIQCGRKAQILVAQIFFYIVVLDRRFSLVDQFHLLRHNIHRHDLIMLRQKYGNRQSHIFCPCYCYLHFSPFLMAKHLSLSLFLFAAYVKFPCTTKQTFTGLPHACTRLKPKSPLQGTGICIGHQHISWLHGNQFLICLKIIILWQHPCPDQLLLQDIHKVLQVLWLVISNVTNGIGRNRKTVLTVLLRKRPHPPLPLPQYHPHK